MSASTDIGSGEVLVTVPRSAWLSAASLSDQALSATLSPVHALALVACHTRTAAAAAPWVALWPTEADGGWRSDDDPQWAAFVGWYGTVSGPADPQS